jgi:hypothetical protein
MHCGLPCYMPLGLLGEWTSSIERGQFQRSALDPARTSNWQSDQDRISLGGNDEVLDSRYKMTKAITPIQ